MYKSSRRCTKKPTPLSRFDSDISETDSNTDTDDNIYTNHNRHHHHRRLPDFNHFPRTTLRLPKHTTHSLRPDTILILPTTLTNLKISLHAKILHQPRTIYAAVAGDMHLRDVIKQILPHEYLGDARVYMKNRGEWLEPGSLMKVSDIVDIGRFVRNERGEVEVKIVVSDGGRVDVREGKKGFSWERERRRESEHGWEKEVGVGRMERMRVY
jgi:hypothetical protein